MSLEKIKAMVEVANQMEEMKKAVIKENVTDRKQLRIKAIKEIQDYFKDVAQIGNFDWVEVPVNIYWLNQNKDANYKLHIRVCDGDVEFWEMCSGTSGLEIKNFCQKTEKDLLYSCSDGSSKWNDGYVPLIENWQTIKKYFEIGLEKQLKKRMETTQKALTNFKTSYEIADKFTV